MRIGVAVAAFLVASTAQAAPLVALAPSRKAAQVHLTLPAPILRQVNRALEGVTLLGTEAGSRLQLKPGYNHGPVASLALHY
jgi:hypothetical protein